MHCKSPDIRVRVFLIMWCRWLEYWNFYRDNIEPSCARRSEHKFLFQTFEKPTICNYCSKFLKGRFFQVSSHVDTILMVVYFSTTFSNSILFQGYRCTMCGIAVHKECIVNSSRCGRGSAPDIPPRPPFVLTVPRSPVSPTAISPTEVGYGFCI